MELIKLSPKEFALMAELIYLRTGIHLPESKLTLLSNRLRKRLRSLELDSFKAYYDLLHDPQRIEEELPHFLSAVTTNETYFFRNEKLWKFFREEGLPQIVERKKMKRSIRIWSAASSSGEEAYTAAICLRQNLPDYSGWRIEIIASDISERMLERAKAAVYNNYAVSHTPALILAKWFDKTKDEYVLKREISKLVSFQTRNLRDPFPNANFDLIFLRNVLMYFDIEMKKRVLKNVCAALAPGGYLVIGDVDPVRNTAELNSAMELEHRGPNLYWKPDKRAAVAPSASKV